MQHLTCFPASSPLHVSMATYQTFWEGCMRSVGLPWRPVGDCVLTDAVSRTHAIKRKKLKFDQSSILFTDHQAVISVASENLQVHRDCVLKITIFLILCETKLFSSYMFLKYLSCQAFLLFSLTQQFLFFRQQFCFFTFLFFLEEFLPHVYNISDKNEESYGHIGSLYC